MSMITVVGGGPAGSKTAVLLAKDHDVRVLEEHEVSGSPVQCTGLISDDVIELSGVKVDEWNSLYGANVHFPSGGMLSARSTERKAVLIDRASLDQRLAEVAQDAGAEYSYGTRYLAHRSNDDGVAIETSNGTISSELIIGADGHRSKVSSSLGNNNAKEYVRGIQMDIFRKNDDMGMIDIFVGSEYAPGFFAWAIPFEDKVRVGLCSDMNALPPIHYQKNILRRLGIQDNKVHDKQCGMIPLGGRPRTYGDRLLLIGDAAGQVKPISGGGLFPAFRSAYCLRETVNESFQNNDLSESSLKNYERRWKSEVGKELRNGYRLRKIYTRMDDRSFDEIHDAMDRDEIKTMLNGISVDHPSDVAMQIMFRTPALLRLAPTMMKAMVRSVR